MKLVITGDTHYGFSDDTERILEAFWKRIKKEDASYVLHAGDWGTSNPKESIAGIRQAHKLLGGGAQILYVFGNHDYWNDETTKHKVHVTVDAIETATVHLAQRLRDGRMQAQGYIPNLFMLEFHGADGWYSHPEPPTKDIMYMNPWVYNQPSFEWLKKEYRENAQEILDRVRRDHFNIFLTHFPGGEPWGSDPAIMRAMADVMNLIVRGHSHQHEDFMWGKCRVLNVGSDYDMPNYIVVTIDSTGILDVKFADGWTPR
jgi:predicted phosphodiesterase